MCYVDYDALLTEKGDITPKYLKTRELLLKYVYKPQGEMMWNLDVLYLEIWSYPYMQIQKKECSFIEIWIVVKINRRS